MKDEDEDEGDGQGFFNMNRKGLPALRDFEAMDLIHDQMKLKTENGLMKVEPLIKK
jgi:hypothetical protein